MIRMHRRNEPHSGGTKTAMYPDVWLAPVRNLTWVAAHFGHR